MQSQEPKEIQKEISAEKPLSSHTKTLIGKFSIQKITVQPSKKKGKDNTIIALRLHDQYGPLLKFIADARVSMVEFKQKCLELIQNTSLSYNSKLKELILAKLLLKKQKNAHNINNRFSFISRPILFLATEQGKQEPRDFNDFLFTDELKNEMKEFLKVRFELFDELLSLVELCQLDLEINAFRYARFKLKQPDGKRFLWELAFALEHESTLLKLNPDDRELFERELFAFFGVTYEGRGKMISNLFAKGKTKPISRGLKRLRDTFNGLNREDLDQTKK
jgi:hypothetical protein